MRWVRKGKGRVPKKVTCTLRGRKNRGDSTTLAFVISKGLSSQQDLDIEAQYQLSSHRFSPYSENLNGSKAHQWDQNWDVASKAPGTPHYRKQGRAKRLSLHFQDPEEEFFACLTLVLTLLSSYLGADHRARHCIRYPV